MKLTARQARFVAEYLVDGNGTEAAVRAGFSARTASQLAYQLLQKPSVRAALEHQRQQVTRATIADAAERREVLTAMFRDTAASFKDRQRAADILNKMDGLYIQKHEVTTLTKPDLSKLSDAELAALEQLVGKAQPTEAVH